MSVTIGIKNAVKRYGENTVIKNLSLDIKESEFFTLLGPSGCGKTTLLRMIAGFNSIEGGDFFFGDRRVNDMDPAKRNIGMVFQNYAIFPNMTVRENVEFGLKNRKIDKKQREEETEKFLRLMQIEEYRDRRPDRLSGGQQQRVALARALVIQPDVLLMDEPLSNLDAKLRTSMRTEIIKLHQKLATTFIYVTHDQTEAMTMGDRIVVMKDGIVQQVDTPQNLYDFPCNMFVAGFIGSPQMNLLDATLHKDGDAYYLDLSGDKVILPKEKTADGSLDAYVGKPVKAGVRPEDIKDDAEFVEKHADCKLTTTVEVSELMGSEIYLYLEYKGNKMTARVAPTSKAKNGSQVIMAFDPHKVHLFDPETELTILN